MSISISDPLALVAIQAGQVGTPPSEGAAAGSSQLDTPQRSVDIGEPVPIVFGRRRTVGGIEAGGVLISPGATECRFENDEENNVTAYYHLVLSEGQIDSIPVKDVFQRSCRVGSHTQTYDRRAGIWTPENVIVEREGFDKPEASYYCGSIGAYPGMSTLSFNVTIPNGSDQWNRQVHCFIRGGMHVTRLYDNIEGPSDNFADLVQWMLTNSGRVPTSLIDTTALDAAATFLEANRFTCNCNITESVNYADLLARWAPYFLLGESNVNGKRGLRSVLPTTEAGAIDTGVITPSWTFTEDHIISGSLEIQYSNLAERQPFAAQMTWRQQLDDDFGIIRTAEVRYEGTAETGPYESHDLSQFCTTEHHAVKVGAYILSRRVRVSHTIRFSARPQSHNTLVTAGDIIRVRLERKATMFSIGYHDFLYQVVRITKTLAGDISYECIHFPVNADGSSLIALDVAAATATGALLSSNKTGVGCDIHSPDDDTIPPEEWSPPDEEIWDPGPGGPGDPGPGGPGDPGGTPPTAPPGGEVTIPGLDPGGDNGGGGDGGGGDSGDSPDDGLDEPAIPGWPPGFITPDDPDWPPSLPSNTDPDNGEEYIEPVGDGYYIEIPDTPFEWVITVGSAWIRDYDNNCILQPGILGNAASYRFPDNTRRFGVFRHFGKKGRCGGRVGFRTVFVRAGTPPVVMNIGLVIGGLGQEGNGTEFTAPTIFWQTSTLNP